MTFATKNGRTCTLTPVELLRRFLLHVLPKGFHKIRHYGLCSNHHIAAKTLDAVRAHLAPLHAEPIDLAPAPRPANEVGPQAGLAPQSWLDCLLALTGIDALRCPRCQGTMVRLPLDAELGSLYQDTS